MTSFFKARLNTGLLMILLALSQGLNAAAPVVNAASHEERLQRLERMGRAKQEVELLSRINELQNEVQELRGLVEEQAYQLEKLTNSQRNLFMDLDTRLGRFEKSAASSLTANSAKRLPMRVNPSSAELPKASSSSPSLKTAGAATAAPMSEQEAYQKAYALIGEKRYQDAIKGLTGFLGQYPHGEFAANAHYWLGELYLVEKQLTDAEHSFTTVIKQHSHHHKVADALVKLGFVYYEKGHVKKATELFNQVQTEYPNSSAARIALARLQQMNL